MRRLKWLLAFAVASLMSVHCGSDESESTNPIPGDSCDASKPLVCGSLSAESTVSQVVLFCRDGVYETVMECRPVGGGETNRCFEQGNSTVVDCTDEPEAGSITRCEVTGSGADLAYECSVVQLG